MFVGPRSAVDCHGARDENLRKQPANFPGNFWEKAPELCTVDCFRYIKIQLGSEA